MTAHASPNRAGARPAMPFLAEPNLRCLPHPQTPHAMLEAVVSPCLANPCPVAPCLTQPILVKLSASLKPPFETEPLTLLTAQTSPSPVAPSPNEPRHAVARLLVSPPHSRLSLSGYRLFTALATSHPAAPGHISPAPASPLKVFYRSALDAMPVRALTFAIASMFARR